MILFLILILFQNLNVLRSDRRRCNIFALRRNSLQYNNNDNNINNNNYNIALIISSVIDFPIVGVFVVVGHRWGRMIRFGESERGGSRLASEVRESSVVLNHVWAQSNMSGRWARSGALLPYVTRIGGCHLRRSRRRIAAGEWVGLGAPSHFGA